MSDLDTQLLQAHEAGDREALWRLYLQAGETREVEHNIEAACFYFTQAYVFALELNHSETDRLAACLRGHGRL